MKRTMTRTITTKRKKMLKANSNIVIRMETDIGEPIDFHHQNTHPVSSPEEQQQHHQYQVPNEEFYMQPPPQMVYAPPPNPPITGGGFDLTQLNKTTYIVVAVAFILGFFIGTAGKTQPILLRYS